MNMIDLHVHSNKSDGSFSPTALVQYAVEKGLSAFALTDHDTIDGIAEAVQAAKALPNGTQLEVIPGIEFSTQYGLKDIHILGLYVDYENETFCNQIKTFVQERVTRNEKMCIKLQRAGVDISYESLLAIFPGSIITRGHYARYLLDHGYVKSLPEAFERYVGDHCPYFVPREKISPEQAVFLIIEAGGIPILAHPTLYHLGAANLETLVCRLKEAGLMAIEAVYSTHSPAEERKIRKLAQKHDLLISGGSDFHGTYKPKLDLGVGYGKLFVCDEILLDLKKQLGHGKKISSKSPAILFTDLDGTLLDRNKKISNYTREILRNWTGSGNKLALSSGRAIASILDVQQELGLNFPNMYLIGYNGSEIYDCDKKESIYRVALSIDETRKIIETASSMGIHCHSYTDTHIVSAADNEQLMYYKRAIHTPVIFSEDIVSVLDKPPCKCVAIELIDKKLLDDFRKSVGALLGENVTVLYSNPKYLELFPTIAGKGSATLKLCTTLNIAPSACLAFGDEENDISMLKVVGTGVAMKNARETVKEVATLVTDYDNDNDGLAKTLVALHLFS